MEKKKKILFVHHSGQYGGAPKSMSYIIKNIDTNLFENKLINISNGPINDFFEKQNINFEIVKGIRPFHGSTVVEKEFKLFIRNWIFLITSIIKAKAIIKIEKPDLIHLNSTCLFAFAIAARSLNIKVICHVREPIRKGLWGLPLRFFCKKYIDGFIAICKNDLDSLKLSKKDKKIKQEVIYNFVDTIQTSKINDFSLKEELKISKNSIVFLYLARFANSNGWLVLIEMAKKSICKNKNYHFVLVGAIESIHFNHTKSNQIHILPFRQDINYLLNGSDIFVCPFTEPHFARGVIEASAFGLPIIGANIGGVDELIIHKETGFLYDNEKEFLEYCELLGSNQYLREQIGLYGIKNALENFEINKNLNKTFNFYNHFLK